jgi:hypothetical protein
MYPNLDFWVENMYTIWQPGFQSVPWIEPTNVSAKGGMWRQNRPRFHPIFMYFGDTMDFEPLPFPKKKHFRQKIDLLMSLLLAFELQGPRLKSKGLAAFDSVM